MHSSEKTFKTYQEQICILKGRGMIIEHPRFFTNCLQKDDYYNIINGYKTYFLQSTQPEDKYIPGTTFEQLYALYVFDKTIRSYFFMEILSIEKNLKSLIAYHFSERYGYKESDYLSTNCFRYNSSRYKRYTDNMLAKIFKDIKKYSKSNNSIGHYKNAHGYIPLWVLNNVLSLGCIAHFYDCMKSCDQKIVAAHFKLTEEELAGFIYFIDIIRNACAHGGRIYTSDRPFTRSKYIPSTKYHEILNN